MADLRALRDLVCINLLLTIPLECCLDHSSGWPSLPRHGVPVCWEGRVVACKSTHIIPFSIHDKPILRYAIEMFTGRQLRTENIQHLINHPANVINIEYNAHESMVRKLAWGIEARSVNNERKYYFRVVKPDYIYATIQLNDGDEIEFGRGSGGATIALPDPRACNLHLAIARVFAASGAAEVVDKYLEDLGDDPPAVPIHFGRSAIPDEILVRGLGVAT
ncbi:hypothetical protein BGY98DRAFT_235614 [Russula aff. rugulosa BPL654]|nr:hypothetical protein BGY98DRAFT_235614 [Russula aff. rugulosa BPL654]